MHCGTQERFLARGLNDHVAAGFPGAHLISVDPHPDRFCPNELGRCAAAMAVRATDITLLDLSKYAWPLRHSRKFTDRQVLLRGIAVVELEDRYV